MKPSTGKPQAHWTVFFLLLALPGVKGFAQTTPSPNHTSRRRQIVVSLTDRKLAVLEDGIVIGMFPVAVGASSSPSPTGEFEIINRVSGPTYYHAGEVIPPGRNSPIGTRWVGLSKKGYGIHGTNAPRSIGKAASHGCIRLRNRDMERLFVLVRTGDKVEIHGERDPQIAQVFGGQIESTAITLAQAETSTAEDGGQ
jgi:lipoprotein-anchoring transpeptidase ErfK/SrfK